MRKIISFFAFVAIVFSFAACGGKGGLNDAYWANWEGEYEATEIVEAISTNGEPTEITPPTRTMTVTIFRDTYLYVQSYSIGDPFIPGVDPENHTVILRAPKRMPADADPEDEDPEESSGIENVVATPGPHIILRNGGVFSIFKDNLYAPKAIQAVAASETELSLLPGQPFDVEVMNEDNIDLGTVTCNWTYSTIRKEGDTYSWEAVLNISPATNDGFNAIRHILTMTKKPSLAQN